VRHGTPLDRSDPLYLQATSACLATIVVMQMMNIFLCRHPLKSSLSFGLIALKEAMSTVLCLEWVELGHRPEAIRSNQAAARTQRIAIIIYDRNRS